jgi:hypothetical protein
MRPVQRAVHVALVFFVLTLTGHAAGVSVRGTVADPAGAALPGAVVELVSGTTAVAKTTSGPDGGFVFENVATGSWRLATTSTPAAWTR